MSLKIRPLRKQDIPACSKIFYSEFLKQDKHWTLKTARARVAEAFRRHPSWCFVLVLKKEIIGFVLAEKFHFAKGKYLFIADIAVSSKYQKRGYGKRGLQFVIKKAKQKGYKEVVLLSHPTAFKFYKKLGLRKSRYIHMWKDISKTNKKS